MKRLLMLLAFGPLFHAAATDDVAALRADAAFFTEGSCRQLRAGVGSNDLSRFRSDLLRRVAAGLLDGTYDLARRAAEYPAYPTPAALARTLKLGEGFSRFEGITGICLDSGLNVVLVGETGGRRLRLLVPDWTRQPPAGVAPDKDPAGWGLYREQADLAAGVNVIQLKKGGLAYVSYYADDADQAPAVAVHLPMGRVNGWFDATRQSNADWDRLLDGAVSPILDARGKHIQVAYPVEWLKAYARGRGVELIGRYDEMLRHHYTFAGWVKYGRVPRNRILARVNYNYYMFRDGDGVAYLGDAGTMRMVADPDVVIRGDPCWGFCHEVGHVLQMSPQLNWGGLGEVSGNLFSLYTGGQMGNAPSRLHEQDNYASARRRTVEAQPRRSYLQDRDVFNRLVPFWQLHLYIAAHGRPDFYADVMEELRRRTHAGTGDEAIRNQFEFVKVCCAVAKLDLTDFFERWGFFWTGELTVNDYGRYRYVIAPEMVAEVRAWVAAQKFPPPAEDLTQVRD